MGYENKILDLLLSSPGKAAPYITENLSKIGDGSMAKGLRVLSDFSTKSGMEIGEKVGLQKGVCLGVLGTLTVLSAIKVVQDFRQKRVERTAVLQEVNSKIKIADTESESTAQSDETPLSCEGYKEHKDGGEIQA